MCVCSREAIQFSSILLSLSILSSFWNGAEKGGPLPCECMCCVFDQLPPAEFITELGAMAEGAFGVPNST